MALVNRSLMLDITPGAIPKVVNVSEYDQNRQFTVNLIDEGGVFEIPSGTTATVEGTIGGSGFSETATVSGNTIVFELSESMTAYAGDAWVKIKLTKDSKPIQTCAFILRCDKAGVEADTVIGASGFEEQINEGVAEYFDNDPPFFELPSGGQSGQALLSDGNDGAHWGDVQSGGTGLSDDAKAALLACFRNVAWVGSDGQSYYDDLYDALYPPAPPATLLSISAAFNQGSAVIYDTDSLDTLKQYLTVTARYSNGTTQTVTSYVLSGTLTAGTSTITVSYGGKNTTFNVTVTHAEEYITPGTYALTDSALWLMETSMSVGEDSAGKTYEQILLPGYATTITTARTFPVSQNGFGFTWNDSVYNIFPAYFDSNGGFAYRAFSNIIFITSSPKNYSATEIANENIGTFCVAVKRKDGGNMTASDIANLNLTLVVN